MFEAYSESRVAYKLPLEILSITAKDSNVIAGTKSGALLTYEPNKDGKRQFEVQMSKSFSKRAVNQLSTVPSLNLLLCLSDSLVTVYDLIQANYVAINVLQKTKGATLFSTYTDQSDNLYLCVVVRKRLQFYQWEHTANEFVEMAPLDLSFPDAVQTVCWCGSKVAVAVRDEYFLINVIGDEKDDPIGAVKQLFTVGSRSLEPVIVPLYDRNLFGFCRDETMLLVTCAGSVARQYKEIPWSEVPAALVYDSPYLVALLSKHVEIRSVKPSLCVQIINFPKARYITRGLSGQVFIASAHDIWCLWTAPNLKNNLQQLVNDKEYDLAVQLAQQSEDKDKEKRIEDIKHLYAFHLFCQRKFTEAFELFSQIESQVLYVIGLFDDLLPVEIRKNITYPDRVPALSQDELKIGYQALTKYLSEIRTKIAQRLQLQTKLRDQNTNSKEIMSDVEMDQDKNILQVVDTTLLKCYLQTNDMLVCSLLRLPDNSCNVTETEKILRSHCKYYELFLLYERKNMHNEALKLLKDQSKINSSPLRGIDRTVHYLQNLGNKNLDLIFQFASWVLSENPKEGLKIFTEECDEVKELDREKVLTYLMREAPTVVIEYLEHVIFQWDEEKGNLHDLLAEHYVIRVKRLITDYVDTLPRGQTVAKAGEEPGDLGHYRSRLLYFLEFSLRYSAEMVLVQIPHDGMYEERALLYGRLKRHTQAIAIYTNVLHDYKAAEKYCNDHYNRNDIEDSKVYVLLLSMYALPPDPSILGLLHSSMPRSEPNVPQALKVLKDYAHRIDTVEGVQLLCEKIRLDELWISLEAVLQQTANKRRTVGLNRSLYYANKLRTNAVNMTAQSVKLTISYESTCAHCDKKISNSAFARFPDGTLVHYYCYKQKGLGNIMPKR